MAVAASSLRTGSRHWPLGAAAVLLAALWSGPLPSLARISFSWHMILHLGVMLGAAPLLALGLARSGLAPRRAGALLAIGVSMAELAVVWGWHVPGLHEAAALSPLAFAMQQGSFLVAGTLVWLPGLAPGRAAAGSGGLALMMSFMHMSMLGVLLATAPGLIYAPEICGGAWGLTPLQDQRLGGVLMALGGGLPYFAGAAILIWRFLSMSGQDRA
ncbi:cytochrome c oxidase assembly protein [Palleronia sp.]|uniref:cytochrome c oxidase assembly protein n=1 Tax=Palleronia sp. TaxID=1940284 RepID=UPI0035C78DC1